MNILVHIFEEAHTQDYLKSTLGVDVPGHSTGSFSALLANV